MAKVLDRIKLEMAQKRVRPKEFFADFDTLRRGEVSEAQFKRALSMMNFSLSHSEMDELAAQYCAQPGLINYRQFLTEMEAAFLDESEPSPVKAAQKQLTSSHITVTGAAGSALDEIKRVMAIKRILLKPQFKDFDRSNTGHVTRTQFIRVLTANKIVLEPALLEAVIQAFTDSHLGVNYHNFCVEIDSATDLGGLNSGPIESIGLSYSKPPNTQDLTSMRFFDMQVAKNADPLEVEERLKAEVAMKGIRASEFFRDFDKLRKGTVRQGQFCSALGMMNLRLSEADINALLNKYKDASGDIRYAEFCRYVESAPELLDKMPEYRASGPVDTMAARRKFKDFTDAELQQLHDALQQYQVIVRQRRVHLRPIFQDFDIGKTGHVTRFQFGRVLDQLALAPSEPQLKLLLKRYLDKGNNEEVNYMDFCRDVDKPEDIFTPSDVFIPNTDEFLTLRKSQYPNLQYTTKPVVEGRITSEQPENLEDVLAKVRKVVKQNRIRLNEFTRDFDRLRSGIITNNQLRIAFSMGKIQLSEAEFELLCNSYAVDPTRVNYTRLLDDIDLVFTTKGLEKTNADMFPVNTEAKYGRTELSLEESQLVREVQARFAQFEVTKYIDMKSQFQDWDRHNIYKISPKQFRQALAQLGFIVNDSELSLILRQYGTEGQIRYMAFINDSRQSGQSNNQSSPSKTMKGGSFNINTPYCMNKPPSEDVQTLLRRIQQGVKTRRVRAQEFMVEHDPLHKGIIPKSKFRSALDNMSLGLSASDIDLLESYFAINRDQVNYNAFVEVCEEVFTIKNLEKVPEVRPSDNVYYSDPKDSLNPQEQEKLEATLQRLGYLVRTRRVYMKPFFQDKDKVNAGWVTTTRFRSILNFAGLPIDDQEYHVLCKRFSYKMNEVNYVEFCKVIARYSGDDTPF